MAIIARAVKLGGATDYAAGFDILASEVNLDLNTLYSDYNGNITTANLSASAGVKGTQCASKPNGMDTANINTGAVTTTELGAGAVTKDKVSTTPGLKVTHSQLEMLIQATAFSYTPGGVLFVYGISASIEPSGGNYVIRVLLVLKSTSTDVVSATTVIVNPSPVIPTVSRSPIAVYLQGVTGLGSATVNAGINITHIAIS